MRGPQRSDEIADAVKAALAMNGPSVIEVLPSVGVHINRRWSALKPWYRSAGNSVPSVLIRGLDVGGVERLAQHSGPQA